MGRLRRINHQLLKSREIENDRLREVKRLTESGPVVRDTKKVSEDIVATELRLEQQRQANESAAEEIANLKDLMSVDLDEVAKEERKVSCPKARGYNTYSATHIYDYFSRHVPMNPRCRGIS